MAFFDECCLKMTSQTHNNQQQENGGAWGEQEEDELALDKASVVDALWEEEFGADEFNFLEDDDMHIFGQNPLTDILNLVSCNLCKKPVIDSQFVSHYERCNATRQSELLIVLPDHVRRRRRSLRRRAKEKLATVPEKASERSDQRDLHNNDDADDQRSALPLLEKGEGKAEVSERSDTERNISEVEKMVPLKSKSTPNPRGPLVSDETPQKEVRRRGLRTRKRDVSAVCSDVRSQLLPPLSVSRKRKGHSSTVLPGKFSHRPSCLPISSERRIHTHQQRGDDEVKELSGARKRDIANAHAKEPPESGETTIDKETQRSRQVAERGNRQQKQGVQPDDKKGDGAVKTRRKQGTNYKRGDTKEDEAVKSRPKQDRKSSVYKSLGDASRASRREQRNRLKNHPGSLKKFIQKLSSKNCASEELKAAMKSDSTESPIFLSECPDLQGHSGNLR